MGYVVTFMFGTMFGLVVIGLMHSAKVNDLLDENYRLSVKVKDLERMLKALKISTVGGKK